MREYECTRACGAARVSLEIYLTHRVHSLDRGAIRSTVPLKKRAADEELVLTFLDGCPPPPDVTGALGRIPAP